jgi:hypothetical protein
MGSSEVGIAGGNSATHAEHSAASTFTLDVLHSSSPYQKFRKAKMKESSPVKQNIYSNMKRAILIIIRQSI